MKKYTQKDLIRKNCKRIPIKIGTKYNKFTIIDNNMYFINTSNHVHVKCKCDCGFESYQRLDHLKKEKNKSCRKCFGEENKKYQDLGNITSKMYCAIKTRCRQKNIKFEVSIEYLNELYEKQNKKCAISKVPIVISSNNKNNITASLDKINNSIDYIEGNVQWLHKRINIMKGNMKQSDFINVCKLIYKNNKNLKDNFDPSTLNELTNFNVRVNVKEQRLTVEDSIQ